MASTDRKLVVSVASSGLYNRRVGERLATARFLVSRLTYLRILSDQQAGRGWAFVSRGTRALEENMCTLSTLNVSPAS